MQIVRNAVAGLVVLLAATPAIAQEVLVTAQRRDPNSAGAGFVGNRAIVAAGRPVIVLQRTADYAVLPVRITGDTRELKQRRDDLQATIRNAIDTAAKSGIELATGDYIVRPLTLTNYAELKFNGDGRPDTDQASFLVKLRLAPGMDLATATNRLTRFVEAIPKVGRSTVVPIGEVTLSVVDPDQYRAAIIDLIAADARTSAAKFGPSYGVQVTGLDRPVEWTRAGPTEVFLYLQSSYTITKD